MAVNQTRNNQPSSAKENQSPYSAAQTGYEVIFQGGRLLQNDHAVAEDEEGAG